VIRKRRRTLTYTLIDLRCISVRKKKRKQEEGWTIGVERIKKESRKGGERWGSRKRKN